MKEQKQPQTKYSMDIVTTEGRTIRVTSTNGDESFVIEVHKKKKRSHHFIYFDSQTPETTLVTTYEPLKNQFFNNESLKEERENEFDNMIDIVCEAAKIQLGYEIDDIAEKYINAFNDKFGFKTSYPEFDLW